MALRGRSSEDEFDPYHKWLGIPKDQRPPTFYQLLGIAIEENDPEAIQSAAAQREEYVRKFLGGPNQRQVESLLFELGEARHTLLNSKLREAYDSKLGLIHRRQQRSPAPATYGLSGKHSPTHVVGEESGLAKRTLPIVAVVAVGLTIAAVVTYRSDVFQKRLVPEVSVQQVAEPAPRPAPNAQPAPVARPVAIVPKPPIDKPLEKGTSAKPNVSETSEPKAKSPVIAKLVEPVPEKPAPEVPAAPVRKPLFVGGPPAGEVITNSIGMKLVAIPAGEFLMGVPPSDPDARPKDQPQHLVRITRPYYLGKYEVTRGQFKKFVEEQNYQTAAERDRLGGYGFSGKPNPTFERHGRYTWKSPGYLQTDDHPLVMVNWFDASAFCSWLSRKENKLYRLPTEAEWEYACRADRTTAWSFGDELQELARFANTADLALNKKFRFTTAARNLDDRFVFSAPVGKFAPNEFGIHDMMGNVYEWCSDWGVDTYYRNSPQDDPTGPMNGSKRVIRGGSWFHVPLFARCGCRDMDLPLNSNGFLGFRVVQVVP